MRWIQVVVGLVLLFLEPQIVAAIDNVEGPDEATVRSAFGLEDQSDVLYQSENGELLTFEQFRSQLMEGKRASMRKNESGLAVLKLSAARPSPVVPTELPDLDRLKYLDGTRLHADDFVGRYTLVSFFYADCAPCIEEVPALNEFARLNPRMAVLAITFDDQAVAADYAEEYGFGWPIAADAKNFIADMNIIAYPSFALLSPNVELIGVKTGLGKTAMNERTSMEDIENLVAALRDANGQSK